MGLTTPLNPSGSSEDHSSQEILLEFRAGKMYMEGRTVHADTRKGYIRVVRADDSLVHFQWWDRELNVLEDDQIVFPQEAVFEKVSQTSGRVYILKFTEDTRKSFFWMQSPRSEDDAQMCGLVNALLNQPLPDDVMGDEEPDSHPELGSESPDGGGTDATLSENVGITEGTPATTGAVQLIDLQRILQGLGQVPVTQDAMETIQKDTGPSFSDILKPDSVLPLLDLSSVEERLVPFLPEGVRTPEAIAELMQSPQFQQQLDMFTNVLRSGQLDWAQFGIDPHNFTVSSFLEAIQDQFTAKDETLAEGQQTSDGQKQDRTADRDSDVMEEGL